MLFLPYACEWGIAALGYVHKLNWQRRMAIFRNAPKAFFLRGLFMVVIFVLCHSSAAMADMSEMQPLNFGRWIVIENNTPSQVTVQTNGSYSNSPQLIMLEPPQQGIYQVTDLPPFAQIIGIDVTMVQPMQGGVGEEFTLDNFQVISPNADGAGMTTLTLGGRAQTSGSGNNYEDSTYNGTLEIDIHL